jgi:hypothetical protein
MLSRSGRVVHVDTGLFAENPERTFDLIEPGMMA